MDFRNFPKHVETLAATWAKTGFTTEAWTKVGDRSATANGAFRVRMASGYEAFAKPVSRAANEATFAAHEKLAADLAFELGLPVPPVALTRPQNLPDLPAIMSLSLLGLGQPKDWKDRGDLLAPHHASVTAIMWAMQVFYTWIGETDHNGHPHNLLFEIVQPPPGAPAFAFIDHAYSLSHGCPKGELLNRGAAPIYDAGFNPMDRAAVDEIVKRIRGLNDERITHIVERVADALTPELKAHIVELLIRRRDELQSLLGL